MAGACALTAAALVAGHVLTRAMVRRFRIDWTVPWSS